MNPCEGFIEVVSFHGGPEVVQGFLQVYSTMKSELRKEKKKTDFNKVCSSLGKGSPKWVTYIIQIFCATSATTSSENMVKIDISGSVDRFFTYVLNYATIHQLTSINETRIELENFRQSIAAAIQDRNVGSGTNSVDSFHSLPTKPRMQHGSGGKVAIETEPSIEEYVDDFDDEVEKTIRSPPKRGSFAGRPARPPSAMHRQMSSKDMGKPDIPTLSPPAVTAEEEAESIYEDDYEEDFENNNSSVFSVKASNAPVKAPAVKQVDSTEEEYPEDFNDFNSSVASVSKPASNGGSNIIYSSVEGSVAEYADDFDKPSVTMMLVGGGSAVRQRC